MEVERLHETMTLKVHFITSLSPSLSFTSFGVTSFSVTCLQVTCWTAPPKQCIEEGGNEEGLNEEGWEGGWKWGGVKWGGGLRRKVEEEGWGGGGVKCLETPNFTLLVALHHFIHKSKIGHDTICRVTILLSSAKRDIFDNYSINSCWINKMNVCIQ